MRFQCFLAFVVMCGLAVDDLSANLSDDVASTLDRQDKNRYILTFCHLSKKSSYYRHFELKTKCVMAVGYFGNQVNNLIFLSIKVFNYFCNNCNYNVNYFITIVIIP